MNLSEVTSPSDLLRYNTPPKTFEEKKAEVLALLFGDPDPAVGLEVAKTVVTALQEWHDDMVRDNIEAGDAKFAAIWARDAAYLNAAQAALGMVNLIPDEDV